MARLPCRFRSALPSMPTVPCRDCHAQRSLPWRALPINQDAPTPDCQDVLDRPSTLDLPRLPGLVLPHPLTPSHWMRCVAPTAMTELDLPTRAVHREPKLPNRAAALTGRVTPCRSQTSQDKTAGTSRTKMAGPSRCLDCRVLARAPDVPDHEGREREEDRHNDDIGPARAVASCRDHSSGSSGGSSKKPVDTLSPCQRASWKSGP